MHRLLVPALASAVLLVPAACGGHPRREAVSDYIERVNAIEADLRSPLADVSAASAAFQRPDAKLVELRPRLARSVRTINLLGRRLAALEPPPDARRLHRLLLSVVHEEGTLASEVEQLGVFLPRFRAALGALAAANTRVRVSLAGTRAPGEQAAALDAYRARVDAVLVRLRALDPPHATAAERNAQVARLARTSTSLEPLAAALREGRSSDVPGLLRTLALASASADTLVAQRAQIAGVRAYNRRVNALRSLAARVRRERNRLELTLR